MPQTRQNRGRPPAKGSNKGRTRSKQRGRSGGRSSRGNSVVVKLPHVGARTAMRTSRRIPHRTPAPELERESDTEAAEEEEEDHESLPPVAAYEEHETMEGEAREEAINEMELLAAESGGRRSRSLAARKDYINRRFLYPGEEPMREPSRHRSRHSRESPHRSQRPRGRRPRRVAKELEVVDMEEEEEEEEEDEDEEEVEEIHEEEEEETVEPGPQFLDELEHLEHNPLRIVDIEGPRKRRGRRRRSETLEEELQMVTAAGHVSRRPRRSSGRRRDEGDMMEVEDVGMTFPTDHLDPRRRRRGRGRPPKSRMELEEEEMVAHSMLTVSPQAPGLAGYGEDDDEEEMKGGAYDTGEFGDEEALLSPSDDSPVLVPRGRGSRSGFEMEEEEDFDDIEEASALVYGRPSRSGHPNPGQGHVPMAKKFARRHKMGQSRRGMGMEAEAMALHGPGAVQAQMGHVGPGPGQGMPPGSGRESVKSEDDMDDEFMFEEGAAFTADNDPPVGGEGNASGLSHTTHHGPMTGLPGHWSAGRRKTPLKPLTAGGPRTSDLDIFMGLEEEGIMPLNAPRGEHSYSAMAQKGGPGHAGGLQDLEYYPPAAPQQYVEPPPDSHVPPPINKPAQHRHGRNSSRRPSILPRRTAFARSRQPSLCVEQTAGSTENVPAPPTSTAPTVETSSASTPTPSGDGGAQAIELPAPAPEQEVSDSEAPPTNPPPPETEPSPAVAASASAKLFHLRNLRRKEEQEKAAALSSTSGIPVESIPPEGAVLVAGIPAFRVTSGGLSILRRIPSSSGQVAVSSPAAAPIKSVLGAANQQAVMPTSGAQLSTGAATPAGDAWLKSKNMRIVVFRNEKGEQKTVVMPEESGVRRIVSAAPQGQLVTPGALGQPILVQQPQQQSQQFVTIQQPQQVPILQQHQPQQLVPHPQQAGQNQPIRYVKIINPGPGPPNQPVITGLMKK